MRNCPHGFGKFIFSLFSTVWFITPLFSSPSNAFDIPKGLTEADQREIIRTLGLNTSTKMLNNPYPLGGFSGFEVGWSMEFVDIRDIRRLGCVPGAAACPNTSYSDESEWRYSRFTVGKGLYEDVDVFFHFMPPTDSSRISDYGGAVRWSFYQARFLPINVSFIGHFNQLNYADSFANRNLGAEIMVGVSVENFDLYFGGGSIQASGTFIGSNNEGACNENCTAASGSEFDASRTITHRVWAMHTVVGLSLHYGNLFGAAEVDRYQDAVYSLKVGLRF